MKLRFTFLILLVALVAKAQTSVYHTFPDSNAVWNFQMRSLCWFPSGQLIQDYSIAMVGDTIINSQVYQKLSTPFVQSNLVCMPVGMQAGYQGAIRQDTSIRKVFYIPPTSSVEELLYDFNLQVGDTVKGFLETIALPKDTVQLIDSILVGSEYRKRWFINSCYNISLIEGIGSTYGLIFQSLGCITDGPDYTQMCFKQDTVTLFPVSGSSCELITSLPKIKSKENELEIYPNPFADYFQIDFEKQFNGSIVINDFTGRKIQYESVNGKSFKINSSNLITGIYLLEIRNLSGELIQTKKLLKE